MKMFRITKGVTGIVLLFVLMLQTYLVCHLTRELNTGDLTKRSQSINLQKGGKHDSIKEKIQRRFDISANSVATKNHTTNLINLHKDESKQVDNFSLYWNLSCPLEMSIFAGSHMDKHYFSRSIQARNLVLEKQALEHVQTWLNSSTYPRRIVFVGDSLMRQIFISLACLSWEHVTQYTVVWMDGTGKSSRTQHPNSYSKGEHSKFGEARVRLRSRVELIYHHGTGNLLELGSDYTTHELEEEGWLQKARLSDTQLTTYVPRIHKIRDPRHVGPQGWVAAERNVNREKIRLNSMDIVLLNGSVHGFDKRLANLENIQKFSEYVQTNRLKSAYPIFAYIMTGVSHFPTVTGVYDPNVPFKDECLTSNFNHDMQQDEYSRLFGKLPILGRATLPIQLESGNLHVGGGDCLHWLQPGIPDLLAAAVTDFATKPTW